MPGNPDLKKSGDILLRLKECVTHRSSTVRNTSRERGHVCSLVLPGETHVVVFTVNGNVFEVLLLELLDRVLNRGHPFAGSSHRLGGEVGVTAGTVPVTGERLGVE